MDAMNTHSTFDQLRKTGNRCMSALGLDSEHFNFVDEFSGGGTLFVVSGSANLQ